jgi:hypothetical protein
VNWRREEDGVGPVADELAGLAAGVRGEEDKGKRAVEVREQGQQLGGLAREGDEEEGVIARDLAQVAVQGLGGVEEDSLDGQAVEGRDELLGDVTRLADADDYQLAAVVSLAADDGVDGSSEAISRNPVG